MKETNEWPAAAYAWSLAGGIPAATTTATQEKKKAKGSGSGSGSGNGSGGGRGSAASSASLSASARDSKGAAPKSKAAKGSKTGKATKPKAKGKPRAAKVAKPKATKAGTAKKKKQSVAAAASAAASAAADAKKGARGKKAPAGSAPRGPFPFALSSAASPSSLASSGSASAPAGIGGPVADAWRETVTHWVPVDVGRFLVNCGPGNETWFELGMFAKRNNITGPMLLAHANTPERLATLFEGYLPPVGREMSFTIMQDLRQQTPYGAQPQPGVASGHITLAANPLPAAGRGRSNAAVVRELRAALKVSQASLAALQAEHAALRASATSSTKSKGLSKSVHLNGFGAGGGSGLLGGAGMGRPGGSGGRSRASSLDMDLTSGHHHAHDLLHSSDAFDDDSIMADGIYTPSEDFNISGEFNSVDNLFALISSKADVADSGPPSPTHRLGGGRSGQQPQHLPHQSHRRQSSSPIPRHSLDIDAQLEQDMDQVLRSATADRNDSASSKRGPAAMNVKQGGTGPMLLPHPAQQPRLIDDLAPGPRTPSLLQQQQLHQQQQQQLHQQKLQQQQQKLHLQQQEKLLQQKLQQQEQAQKLLEQQKLEQQQQQQQLQALLQHKLQETAQAQPRRCLLYEAAQDNDEDALRRLLARKANVNEPNEAESGATALSIAAELNHVESLELLLLAKAHVDAATTDSGETPLFIAACENSADCVRLLLAAKASVNQPTSDDGTTPVCVAAKNDNVASLEMLIAAKADVNQPTEDDGATPVYMASQSNHARSLRLLFKAKAAVNSCLKKNNGGWSPLFVAAGAGHTAVVRALLRHADIRPSVIQRSLAPRTCWNQTIPAGLTPLDVARRLKRTDCVRALANTTASVSAAAAALRAVHSQQIFQNASNGRMSTPSSALTKPGKASGAEIGASRKRPRVQNST